MFNGMQRSDIAVLVTPLEGDCSLWIGLWAPRFAKNCYLAMTSCLTWSGPQGCRKDTGHPCWYDVLAWIWLHARLNL